MRPRKGLTMAILLETALRSAGHSADSVFDQVEKAWADRTRKMDWLGMERALRDFLRYAENANLPAGVVVSAVDEIQAAFTKRGHVTK